MTEKPSYAEILERQLFEQPVMPTQRQRIAELEAELTRLRAHRPLRLVRPASAANLDLSLRTRLAQAGLDFGEATA